MDRGRSSSRMKKRGLSGPASASHCASWAWRLRPAVERQTFAALLRSSLLTWSCPFLVLPGTSAAPLALPGMSGAPLGLLGMSATPLVLPEMSPAPLVLSERAPAPLVLPEMSAAPLGLPGTSAASLGSPRDAITAAYILNREIAAKMATPMTDKTSAWSRSQSATRTRNHAWLR
ncbi:hypothetical protein GGR56DRAFT_637794 [Xylariaceae sp. FL0804]|nr:hypothetical protein GGR56DRAFT_637794 [Xylariaceae sp. FL0804]